MALTDTALIEPTTAGLGPEYTPPARHLSVLEFRPDPAALLAEVRRPHAPRPDRRSPSAPAAGSDLRPQGHFLRRALVLVALVAIMAMGWSAVGWLAGFGNGVAPVGARSTEAAQTVVIVQPGDTLWTIAARVAPADDVRATVDRLAERNGGTTLTVGQRLVVAE